MITKPEIFDMTAAPMRIGAVHLKVRDLEAVAAFYQRILGLRKLNEGDRTTTLGAGNTPLLVLDGDAGLLPGDRRAAGLFHIAFLLPSRADLARWVRHAAREGLRLQGASDHIVSEAFYLADPESNGIEVYSDRPPAQWLDADGRIQMTTEPLDLQALLETAGTDDWAGYPEGGSIGHVHLQVGDRAAADRFYRDVLGFDVTFTLPGASFYGSGGYHHQLAANVWNSRGTARRPARMAGLDLVEIVLRDAADIADILARAEEAGLENMTDGTGTILRDPWDIGIRLTH